MFRNAAVKSPFPDIDATGMAIACPLPDICGCTRLSVGRHAKANRRFHLIHVSRSTWWAWVRSGRYPQPTRTSASGSPHGV